MSVERPPDRLGHDLVVLRQMAPHYIDSLQTAIERSHAALEPWMDWVEPVPQSIDVTRTYIKGRVHHWELGTEFCYVMTQPGTAEVIGTCTLIRRIGEGGLEIGYWVRSDEAGRGVATAAAGLLTESALRLTDVDHLEIHHDAANTASGRVAEKLGYVVVARHEVEVDNAGESGIEMVWRLSRGRL
jgi:RimJ/RimL family protein N-acetyltransferase